MSIEKTETGTRIEYLPSFQEDQEQVRRLIELIQNEGQEPGPAQNVLGARNLMRGFIASQTLSTEGSLRNWFESEVVSEYVGPWAPKRKALDGIRLAIQAGVSTLTEEDVINVENGYKSIIRLNEPDGKILNIR